MRQHFFPSFRPGYARTLGNALCLLVFFLAGLSPGCSSDEIGKKRKTSPAPVVVIKTEQRDVPLSLSAVGNVTSSISVAVTSRVTGQLLEVHFKEGEDVQEGQLLFTIDKRPFEATLREAEARLARDRAQLQKARDDLKRFERLAAGGYTSREQYEQSLTNAAALQATVKADEAAVDSAALQVDYCSITAPVTGRAGAVLIDKGNIIKANDDNRHLVDIDALEPVHVIFSVPETHLSAVLQPRASSPLTVFAAPRGEAAVRGTLTLVDNSVDTRTGTIRLRATFPNKDRALWPGRFVAVNLELGVRKNAITIPLRCVLNGPQGTYVYVVDKENKAQVRPVTLGPEYRDLLVIENGLEPGDIVVADGQVRLAPGMSVTASDSSGS